MKTHIFAAALAVTLGYASCASAYDQSTHRWMTERAFNKSILAQDPTLIESMGIGLNPELPNSDGDLHSPVRLLRDGAWDEDAFPRSEHHFFDPQNGGRPLTVGGSVLGHSSPDWILEPEPIADQVFSLRDAATYYYRGMVGPKGSRATQLGLMFMSLGHVVHHIQDMAQPQHTRNEQHLVGPYSSAYEAYGLARSSRNDLSTTALGYDEPVDLAVFDRARKFWEDDGKGMAEYSATNFVGARTNFELSASGPFVAPAERGGPVS